MPRFVDGAPLQLQSESKAQAFVGLARNSFNYAVLGETAFIGLVRTVGACACYRLTYGALDDAVATMNTLAQSFLAGEVFGATA
jgi:hypothetical protein